MLPGFPVGVLDSSILFTAQMVAADVGGYGFSLGYTSASTGSEYGTISAGWLLGYPTYYVLYTPENSVVKIVFEGDATALLANEVRLRINGVDSFGGEDLHFNFDVNENVTTGKAASIIPFVAGNTYTLELVSA